MFIQTNARYGKTRPIREASEEHWCCDLPVRVVAQKYISD